MDDKNLELKTAWQQQRYIKTLEEQLAVYEEKDKAQQALIEKMEQALQIFAEEISRLKEEHVKSNGKGK